MSHIRGKDTGIEMKLRKALHQRGFSYRCNSASVFGHPDIVNQKLKLAVFCDSEFWHGYNFEEAKKNIKNHQAYWIPKIERNIARDTEVNEELARQGYTVLRYWGFEINKELDRVVEDVMSHYRELEQLHALQIQKKVLTTLCYIENEDSYLMLHRVKKKQDPNEGKWIGVGGHIENGESIAACVKREIKEETGLTAEKLRYVGIIDFLNDQYPPERMYLYTVPCWSGDLIECDEGELKWIKKDKVLELNLWEGDRYFLPLLNKYDEPFTMSLIYSGGTLVKVVGPSFKRRKKAKKK